MPKVHLYRINWFTVAIQLFSYPVMLIFCQLSNLKVSILSKQV